MRLSLIGTGLSIAGFLVRIAAGRRRNHPLTPWAVIALLFSYMLTWLLVAIFQTLVGAVLSLLWYLIHDALHRPKQTPES